MYVDDIIEISQDAVPVIREVAEKFKLKKGKIEPPAIYLGGRLARRELNGNKSCTIISVDYVKSVVKNLE